MPYVARQQQTGQVWTCILTNSYKLTYYGTKYWDWEEDATEQIGAFLSSQGVAEPQLWTAFEVDEAQLKRYNVKLKNDPSLALFANESGVAEIRKQVE
jgi:hypothetical protein